MALDLSPEGRHWACPSGHNFDVAREGYVNLLLAGQRRSRRPGDDEEMISARRRFLATGSFDPLSRALAEVVSHEDPELVIDVGCGEGRHTRSLIAPLVLGIDVAKAAVVAAARAHSDGWYAVAGAAEVPLENETADVAVSVFGPVVPTELARVVRCDGRVVALHPGPDHLANLRSLVYSEPRPHQVKAPLREASEWFVRTASTTLSFPIDVPDAGVLYDLFAMTPYRWHGPSDIRDRLAAAASSGFQTSADVRISTYRRTAAEISGGR
jgi:23S rRNA (guanine745-N1)-methyltransferase